MKLHYADPLPPLPGSVRRALGLPTHGFCGERVHDTEHNWTTVRADVTCLNCVHAMLSVALRDIGDLRAQAVKLYERELATR